MRALLVGACLLALCACGHYGPPVRATDGGSDSAALAPDGDPEACEEDEEEAADPDGAPES